MSNIMNYLQWAVYAAVYFGFAALLSLSLNYRARKYFDSAHAIAGGNTALGFRKAGAQLGLAIAMLGVLLGKSNPDFLVDLASSVGYGFMAITFTWISLFVIDRAVLPNVDNNHEISKGNCAVGVVEFGILVMTGILAFASIYGDGGGPWSSVGYFVLGQATVVVLILLFEKLNKKNRVLENIANGQLAPAIYFAGKAIAYGLILMSAIKGNNGTSTGLVQSLTEFGVAAGIGMVFLYISELLIDKVIITETTIAEMLRKNNVAATLQLSSINIGMALILGFAIL